jgi:hypothetical protein
MHNILAVPLGSMSFTLFDTCVYIQSEATTDNALESISAGSLGHKPRERGTAKLPSFPFPDPTASPTPLIACVDCSVNRLPRSILIMYRYATSGGIGDDLQMPCVSGDGWGCREVSVCTSVPLIR